VVDDEPAHHASRVSHESAAVWKPAPVLARDLNVGFVQDRGRTQIRAEALAVQLSFREVAEFGVKSAEELVRRARFVTLNSFQ